jgi:hypothetical protein
MADFQTVLQVVDTLSDDEKQRLLKYLQRHHVEEKSSEVTQRVLDLHPDAAIMSDDFDEELPDSFWLDEE